MLIFNLLFFLSYNFVILKCLKRDSFGLKEVLFLLGITVLVFFLYKYLFLQNNLMEKKKFIILFMLSISSFLSYFFLSFFAKVFKFLISAMEIKSNGAVAGLLSKIDLATALFIFISIAQVVLLVTWNFKKGA